MQEAIDVNNHNANDLRNHITALRSHLNTMLTSHSVELGKHAEQTHKRLTAAIQSAANATLYEAQLVRRLECGHVTTSMARVCAGRKTER